MVSRLDPDEEAALSVATLEDIMALADILNLLVSMTYLFYGVYRLDPDKEATLWGGHPGGHHGPGGHQHFGFYDLFILWCLGWTLTKKLLCAVAILKEIMALADILNLLVSMTYLFYGV
jgi:hypothetical protein